MARLKKDTAGVGAGEIRERLGRRVAQGGYFGQHALEVSRLIQRLAVCADGGRTSAHREEIRRIGLDQKLAVRDPRAAARIFSAFGLHTDPANDT